MQPPADQRVGLLGPIEIRIGNSCRPVTGIRRKAVLAVLALAAGRTVSVGRLIDIVWSGDPPATAANTLQSHIWYLRGLFRTRDAIVAAAPGYRLALPGDATDLRTAERLVAQAEKVAQVRDRVALLRSALAQWRSRPLADLRVILWFEAEARRLERLHANVSTALVDAQRALGEHAALLLELEDLARQRPLDEALHGRLMLALYRSGRQADAFAVFRDVRVRLREEVGSDPGRPLRELETAMLRQDPSLEASDEAVAAVPPAGGPGVVPAQLPPALPNLVGRRAELRLIDDGAGAQRGRTGDGDLRGVRATGRRQDLARRRLVTRRCGGLPGRSALREPPRIRTRRLGDGPGGRPPWFLEALGVPPQRIP
jgi:DNA-binding SARP family transcriptional activator